MDDEMLRAIMRKRGELNLTNKKLSEITGVSESILSALFNGKRKHLRKVNTKKLNDWLYQQV